MVSYVQCKECGYESKNESAFLDIVLPIMNEFGTGVMNSSLEMAIENYLKPEVLEGQNQYQCGCCEKKVDALKGMKIDKLPDHLMIVLNRFTLDMTTFTRVKINERVTFPKILNMNDYMQGYEGIQNKRYDQEVALQNQYKKKEIEKRKEDEIKRREKLEQKQKDKEGQVEDKKEEESKEVDLPKKQE